MNPKQRAAESALEFVKSGMVLGLGTGSTTDFFLDALGRAIKNGQIRDIRGVPTSLHSEHRAQELGIPLTTLADHPHPDVTVDGADEVAPNLDLIKGLGGALLREKILAQASKKLVIIADAGKIVTRLGTHSKLPVEVTPFEYPIHEAFFRSLGGNPVLRKTPGGKIYTTDNANYIYDVGFDQGITDPAGLESALLHHAGIVETGLFLGIASVVLISDGEHIERRERGR